jgi:Ni/Co efflux regulator RcnB
MSKKHLAMSMRLAALLSAASVVHEIRRSRNVPVRYRNHHYGVNAWREHNMRPPP